MLQKKIKKNLVFLLIGGNIDDRVFYLNEAIKQIEKNIGNIIKKSSIYETEPWGFTDDISFLNQMICVETDKNSLEILEIINIIESDLGRKRTTTFYTSRTIDIDIIFYDNLTIETNVLTIPHKRFCERKFAILPMMEIDKDFIHPKLNKTIEKIYFECKDISSVEIFR